MKSFASSVFVAMFALSLVACDEEDKDCYPPTYHGFTYSPTPVRPGDSVTITVVQAKKGHYLNACNYTLNVPLTVEMTGGEQNDTTITIAYRTNYDGLDNGNPTFKILIPSNTVSEKSSVTFVARWANSADGMGGSYPSTDVVGYWGQITSESYTGYSLARGNFTLPIKQ